MAEKGFNKGEYHSPFLKALFSQPLQKMVNKNE
jgi:hypothetical protein